MYKHRIVHTTDEKVHFVKRYEELRVYDITSESIASRLGITKRQLFRYVKEVRENYQKAS